MPLAIEALKSLNPNRRRARPPAARAFTSFANRDFRIFFMRRQRGDDGRQHRARHFLLGDVPKISFARAGAFAVVSHWVPYLFFAAYTGGLADRFDIRRLIQIGMLLFMGVSIGWGVMFMTDSIAALEGRWLLLVIHGLAGVIWMPASQVLIHRIVSVEQLPSAVRLNRDRALPGVSGRALRSATSCCWYSARLIGIFHQCAHLCSRCSFGCIRAPYGPRTAGRRGRRDSAASQISGPP